jgi:hypothetical protein
MTTDRDRDPDIVIREHEEFARVLADLGEQPSKVSAAEFDARAASGALTFTAAVGNVEYGNSVGTAMGGLATAMAKELDDGSAQATQGVTAVTAASEQLRDLQAKIIARDGAGAESIVEA